jgi:hypothetical protein
MRENRVWVRFDRLDVLADPHAVRSVQLAASTWREGGAVVWIGQCVCYPTRRVLTDNRCR